MHAFIIGFVLGSIAGGTVVFLFYQKIVADYKAAALELLKAKSAVDTVTKAL